MADSVLMSRTYLIDEDEKDTNDDVHDPYDSKRRKDFSHLSHSNLRSKMQTDINNMFESHKIKNRSMRENSD